MLIRLTICTWVDKWYLRIHSKMLHITYMLSKTVRKMSNWLNVFCIFLFNKIGRMNKLAKKRHLSATSSVFHPNMQHPQFYTLSISSLILHFYQFLLCLIIPWISSCSISNSINQNVISSQPFHPQLKCLLFHPCIFHPINR